MSHSSGVLFRGQTKKKKTGHRGVSQEESVKDIRVCTAFPGIQRTETVLSGSNRKPHRFLSRDVTHDIVSSVPLS